MEMLVRAEGTAVRKPSNATCKARLAASAFPRSANPCACTYSCAPISASTSSLLINISLTSACARKRTPASAAWLPLDGCRRTTNSKWGSAAGRSGVWHMFRFLCSSHYSKQGEEEG